jgi:hypothetical protein
MRFLQALRALLQTWQGLALAILAVIGAIYYGPRKMLETWDWYLDRLWDHRVFEVVEQKRIFPATRFRTTAPVELPYSVQDIAASLKRSESSVQKSLKRLRRRGKVEEFQDGWRLKST